MRLSRQLLLQVSLTPPRYLPSVARMSLSLLRKPSLLSHPAPPSFPTRPFLLSVISRTQSTMPLLPSISPRLALILPRKLNFPTACTLSCRMEVYQLATPASRNQAPLKLVYRLRSITSLSSSWAYCQPRLLMTCKALSCQCLPVCFPTSAPS